MKAALPMSRTLFGALLGLTLATSALTPATQAAAQTMVSEPVMRRTIHVPRDKSLQFRLPGPASKIVIAQPEIATVTGTSESTFYVQGIEFGSTNMLVYGRGGSLVEVIDIRVGYDAEGLQTDLAAAYPGERIQVRNLGEMLMLAGDVSTSGIQAGAERLADKYAPEAVLSRLNVKNSQQVILEVRILEVTRSALKDIGVDLSVFNDSFGVFTGTGLIGSITPPHGVIATSGGWNAANIETTLQALEDKGVVRALAKPNIVAISGERATFLAGGEFPFPVPQGLDQITIQFRPYGVRLNFLPTVKENGWIRMAVEPEVSELDPANSLVLRDITVPGLTVRRASTTLDLRPGDTFAMAGMYQKNHRNQVQQTPGLGNIPVLGALFRSAQWRKSETELVILVTPRLATPEDRAVTPIESLPGKAASEKDLFLRGKIESRPKAKDAGAPPAAE
ncbi:type II and III secretion system protein family protein [Phenylobacterium sp.]|uniref:type II and III secretion system protein family protein n=1 Tax=Phenylobacterium sp. TaxID=1871053 RepID=UPI002EDB7A4C